ncbi:hypothetical protein BH20CHL8_BH20CHL8_09530 [soil metagenome]
MASINRLSPILAIAVGVLHAGLAPVLGVADVSPNLVLVAVVLVACSAGLLPGAVWAFSAGLTANVLSGEPMGSIPLTLLAAAALAAALAPAATRLGMVHPVLATFAGSIVADLGMLGIHRLLDGGQGWAGVPIGIILVAAALNAALAALVLGVVWLQRRRTRTPVMSRWPT